MRKPQVPSNSQRDESLAKLGERQQNSGAPLDKAEKMETAALHRPGSIVHCPPTPDGAAAVLGQLVRVQTLAAQEPQSALAEGNLFRAANSANSDYAANSENDARPSEYAARPGLCGNERDNDQASPDPPYPVLTADGPT